MDNYFSNMNLLKIFLKWKWPLLILHVIAALLAIFISSPLIIKPKFRSSTVLYPSNIQPYSDESQTEQMLQWLNSRDIMDSMIVRYDLAKHYQIPADAKSHNTIIEYMYNKHIKINKTQYESIKVDVLDTDPVRARDMVYSIIDFLNLKIRSIHREKYGEVIRSYRQMLDNKKKEIDSVMQQHHLLRTKYELIDYGNQTREIVRGYLRTVDGSNSTQINTREVAKLKANIEEKGGDFIYYNTMIYALLDHYSRIKYDYEAHLYHYNKEFTYVNFVSHPVVSDKKAYPVRWLILAYALLGTAVFSILAIALIENTKSLKDRFAKES